MKLINIFKYVKGPESLLTQGLTWKKDGGFLLSRIALQYHRRRRA